MLLRCDGAALLNWCVLGVVKNARWDIPPGVFYEMRGEDSMRARGVGKSGEAWGAFVECGCATLTG